MPPLSMRSSSVRSDLLERRFKRYCPLYQGAVRALASRHPRIADLALSFPTLLFALAAPRCGLDPARAIARVIEGAPLASVAAAAEVPMWLRGLPPETFSCPVGPLPGSPSFRRRIVNHLPSRKLAPKWLRAVSEMADVAHEDAAIWIAREIVREARRVSLDQLRLLGLWVWFSNQPGTFSHSMINKRWMPDVQLRSALDAVDDWRTNITLHANLGRAQLAELWLQPGHVRGYDFRPLASVPEIAEEAMAMNNCLRTFGDNLAHNRCRLWSLRKDGQRVATLQVAFRFGDPLPNVVQLKGHGNSQPSLEVWLAARHWLIQHDLHHVDPKQRRWDSVPLDRSTWIALWRPYWLAKRRFPDWLPLAPSRRALAKL
jgi:hypothetical protein